MRILFATSGAPDPEGAPVDKWIQIVLSGLARRGHEIVCWCVPQGGNPDAISRRARAAVQGLPITLRFHTSPVTRRSGLGKLDLIADPFRPWVPSGLSDEIRQACDDRYDVFNTEFSWLGSLGFGIPRSVLGVHFFRHVELRGTGMWPLSSARHRALVWYGERHLVRRSADIRVLSQPMSDLVRRINPGARTHVVPIAIDVSQYPMRAPDAPSGQRVGLIAHMGMPINFDSAMRMIHHIWPRVIKRCPSAELVVGGWGADRIHTNLSGVTVVSNVPSAAGFFAECDVFAYPLTGGAGLHGKILEAMAYGVPVVSTADGMEGVDAVDGVHAFIQDDDDAIADRIVMLLADSALRGRVAEAARQLVEDEYSPDPVVAKLERVFQQVSQS